MALTLTAGPAPAAAKPVWAMTAGNVRAVSGRDSRHGVTLLQHASGLRRRGEPGPRPLSRLGTRPRPVLSYTSYAQFKSNIQSGAIRYPYHWVMYDPEHWYKTPVSEQQSPARYMTLFGQLAHAHGLKVILAPSLDLASVTGSVLPAKAGETANQWYLRVNIAGKAAAASDIYLFQDESNTTAGGAYASMFNYGRPGPGRERERQGVLRGLDR